MKNDMQTHDAVIAGGGLVGLTCALAANAAGLKLAVIDPLPFEDTVAEQYDGRSSAISFANMRLLDALGVKDRLHEEINPINRILVSDGRATDGLRTGGPGPFFLQFDRDEITETDDGEPLGWMVENRYMRMALLEEARNRDGIMLIDKTSIADQSREDGRWTFTLANGDQFQADLLIGAEGRRSPTRERAGIRVHGWGYGQWGVVTTVKHAEPHHGIAHEYFLPNGPFAILPLSHDRCSLVWTETPNAAQYLKTCEAEFFQAELERRFGSFLGELTPVGPRFAYPLTLQIAENYVDDGMVLVGDAAHGMHPIAGQGFNAGIRDVGVLADELASALRAGLSVADGTVLSGYEKKRRFDNASLLAATDMFVRLFSNDIAPVRLARGLVMSMVDAIPPARKFFAREAGGGIGALPNLLRSELP